MPEFAEQWRAAVEERRRWLVTETLGGERESLVTATEADAMIAQYETDPQTRACYDVRRRWDGVAYVVAVAVRGRALPFLSYSVELN